MKEREDLFYAFKNYPSLQIFGIDDYEIEDLSVIVQNELIIDKNELIEWVKKTNRIKKKMLIHLKNDNDIIMNWDLLVNRVVKYYVKNKKLRRN